ncbi:MAG: hypothetical protein LUD81_05085 [Clostridiales bacterium]|nr:hypothetical protein [Clostridiales bacterium]
MIKSCKKTNCRCKYYRPLEGDFSLSEGNEGCGSCVYFSSKNCRRHSLDEIPDFFEQQ